MATWTAAQVSDAVLERLGVKALGNSASGEDSAKATAAYTSFYYQLRRKSHAPWAIGAVAEEAQQPLAAAVAARLAGEYGITGQRRLELDADGRRGEMDLAEMAAGDKQNAPIVGSYF